MAANIPSNEQAQGGIGVTVPHTEHGDHLHHDAHDDHHHHDQHWLWKYVFSQDHKQIAKQFLITGMLWAILGGILSSLFRLQLGWPEATMEWLQPVLGKWISGGKLDPEFYLALVTMHGTIMVFFVLTAGLSGTFSNFLIPLQVGARDMASGFMNMPLVLVLLPVERRDVLLAVPGIRSCFAGWTIYPPLSALPQAISGSGTGMTMWLVSMALFIVSQLLGGVNYVTTVINLRTRGMSMSKLPLTIWAFLPHRHPRYPVVPGTVLGRAAADFRPLVRHLLLPVGHLHRRAGAEQSGRLAGSVPALVLVPGSPRGVHRYHARHGYGVGSTGYQRPQAHLRLPRHDWLPAGYLAAVVRRVGSPHVHHRHEPLPRLGVHVPDADYRRAFGREGVQLAGYAVAR
jgi:hypothetical protein